MARKPPDVRVIQPSIQLIVVWFVNIAGADRNLTATFSISSAGVDVGAFNAAVFLTVSRGCAAYS